MILRTVRDVSMLYYDAAYLSYGQDLLIPQVFEIINLQERS